MSWARVSNGWMILSVVIVLAAVSCCFIPVSMRATLVKIKGDIEASCGNKTMALADYRSAVSLAPEQYDAMEKAAMLLEDDQQYDQSFDNFKRLHDSSTAASSTLPHLVSTALKRHKPEEALPYAQEWVARQPKNAQAYHARGLVYNQMDKPEAALDDLNKCVQLDPSSSAVADRDDMVQKFREWKNITGGIFDPKLENSHKDYAAMVRDGRRLFRGYSWDQAEDILNQAIKLEPKQPAAYLVRAQLRMEARRYAAAIADIETVQQLANGKNVDLPQLSDEPVARVAWRCHVAPSTVWYYRADANLLLKNWNEARACCDKALKLPCNSPFVPCQIYNVKVIADKMLGDSLEEKKDATIVTKLRERLAKPGTETAPSSLEDIQIVREWF